MLDPVSPVVDPAAVVEPIVDPAKAALSKDIADLMNMTSVTAGDVVKVVGVPIASDEASIVVETPIIETPIIETPVEEPKPGDDVVPKVIEEDAGLILRQQLNEMAKKSLGLSDTPPVVEPVKPVEPVIPKVEVKPEIGTPTKLSFTRDEFGEAMDNEDGFNKVFTKVEKYVQEEVQHRVEGRITDLLKTIPQTIGEMVRVMVDLKSSSDRFYARNKDLEDFRPFVSLVGNEVMAKNPNKPLDEIFVEVEKEVRKRLKLPVLDSNGTQRPAFVTPSSSRKPQAPVLTGQKAQIAELFANR